MDEATDQLLTHIALCHNGPDSAEQMSYEELVVWHGHDAGPFAKEHEHIPRDDDD